VLAHYSTCPQRDQGTARTRLDISQTLGLQRLSTGYCWALIGNDSQNLAEERAIGVDAKLVSLSWERYFPREGAVDTAYREAKWRELAQLRAAGFETIFSPGIHDPPA
jgi:hypothetical protein